MAHRAVECPHEMNLSENMRAAKKFSLTLVIAAVTTGANAGNKKGLCPPTPDKPHHIPGTIPVPQNRPTPDSQFLGTVIVMAVISDTGYVCDAQVLQGVNKTIDATAISAVRDWHPRPAQVNGRSVPATVAVQLHYWDADGKVVQFPATPTIAHTSRDSKPKSP